jgi:hypothetical protein
LIPTLGLIGAPLLIVSTIGIWFGVNDQVSAWHGISAAPIFLWELSLGLWMTFKGFNRSSPVLVDGVHPTTGQGRLVTPSDALATPA